MGVCQYGRYLNVITASGYASGMHQVIALSVELGDGGFGARPHNSR